MSKERFLTVLIPIKDADCEATVYADLAALEYDVPPSIENINKIYKVEDGTYYRVWKRPSGGVVEYHAVTDREFPYLGKPLNIYDFTYDATRMGSAATISAQGVMWYADKGSGGKDITLDGLWTQYCHVVFNGENMYLKQIPTSGKSNEDARYKYDLDFVSECIVLENVYIYDVVSPYISDKPVSENSTFSFYGDIYELSNRINASLIRSGLASLSRKSTYYDTDHYVDFDEDDNPIPAEIPYLTYEQWLQVGVDVTPLIGTVFEVPDEAYTFYTDIYQPLGGNYSLYLMEYIFDNEDGVYSLDGYQCVIGKDKEGNPTTSEEKLVSFDKNTIHEALQQFHDTFGLQYYITREKDSGGNFTGNTLIVIGDCEYDFADIEYILLEEEPDDWETNYSNYYELVGWVYVPLATAVTFVPNTYYRKDYVRDDDGIPTTLSPFDYGVANELLSKEKTNTTDKIVTRITGVGSTENIPWHYPNPNPDGWIKPVYTRDGDVLGNVTIDYPEDTGTTAAEQAYYEKYLKNRIGILINRGLVKSVIYGSEYSFVDYNGAAPRPEYGIHIRTVYDIPSKGISSPETILEFDYNPLISQCSGFTAQLYRIVHLSGDSPGTEVLVDSYSSSSTYSEPTEFQSLFINNDGKHICTLSGSYNYRVHIVYHLAPNADFSAIYDYKGHHYDAVTLNPQDVPEDHDNVHYAPMPAYIGEDFYSEENLEPFAVWGDDVEYQTILGVTHEFHHIVPTDAGYSTNGDKSGKVANISRRVGFRYKDTSTNVVYRCDVATENSIVSGQPSPAFTSNAGFDNKDWVRFFVNMKLSLYANDGWYIGSKKVQLLDYGLGTPTPVTPNIFDAIEFQRVKWVTPLSNLMPEVFIKTDGERRFYNAHNYWDEENSELYDGTADPMVGDVQVGSKVRNPIYKEEESDPDNEHYEFENEYTQQFPHEHIEDFDDVKPTINGQKNYVQVHPTEAEFNANKTFFYTWDMSLEEFVQCTASSVYSSSQQYFALLRIDVVAEFAYDVYDSDEIWESNENGNVEGDYKHPYFFARLRPLGFNLFDLALQEDMVLSMTTGNCGACNFKIGVDENTKKNPVQLWLYDVYKGGTLATATKVYDAGTLRRYVDTIDLYYDTDGTQEGYVSVDSGTNSIRGGMLVDSLSSYSIFETYMYSGSDVTNGFVGSLKQSGKTHFEGDVVTNGRFIDSQQDTTDNYVWVALMKDTETYGTIMPSAMPSYDDASLNRYIEPKGAIYFNRAEGETSLLSDDDADKFVFTNIRMPQVYLRRAEHELARRLVKYMYENNYQRFNFSLGFSRIYMAENDVTCDNLNENSVMYVLYDNKTYRLYAKHYSYTMTHDAPLPEIKVDMNEELSVSKTFAEQWDEKSIGFGKSLSSRFVALVQQTKNNIDKRTVKRSDDVILSGNVIVGDTSTSLIELGKGGSGSVELITINDIDNITSI